MTFTRARLWELLRDEPQQAPTVLAHSAEGRDDYIVETLKLRLANGETTRGRITRPAEIGAPLPAILFLHSHGGHYDVGADELLEGQDYIGAYGPILARRGYVTLSIDMPLFGTRRQFGESGLSKALLWRGKTLMGQMLAELSGALGYLASRPDVDAARIGAFGMSMGCTHGFMLAALDDRIKAVAHLCCFADYGIMIDLGAHDGHGHYMTIPGLVEAMSTGEIGGAIAPRPQLICIGDADSLTPPAAFARARAETEAAYDAAAAADQLQVMVEPGVRHQETSKMRAAVLDFFARRL